LHGHRRWGCVSTINCNGQTIFVADGADEKLIAFLELEKVTRESLRFPNANKSAQFLAKL
jgi:hypothetical protein